MYCRVLGISSHCCDLYTGVKNGYFEALLPAHPPDAAPITLPGLPTLWEAAQRGFSSSTGAVHAQLALCALQRIDTLQEQLLHKQYTCPLIFARPADQAYTAPAPAALGSAQTDSQAGVQQGPDSAVGTQQAATSQGPGDDPLDDAEQIKGGLTKLSDQVLQFATASLISESEVTNEAADSDISRLSTSSLQTAVWQQVSDRLVLLAEHASTPFLQCFVWQLLQCCIRHSSPLSPHDQDAAAAAAPFAVFGNSSFVEQPHLQQAWLHAVQQMLTVSFVHMPSPVVDITTDRVPERGHNSGSKRRKGERSQQAANTDTTGTLPQHGRTADLSVAQQLAHMLPQIQDFFSSDTVLSQGSVSHNVSVNIISSSKLSGASPHASGRRKRKAGAASSSDASLHVTALAHVTGLLQHTALMPLGLLSSDSASSLAHLMLQAQLWLAPHIINTASAAATTASETQSQIISRLLQALLASQEIMTKCLKASPDAVAASLLQAGPCLWQWVPVSAQLACVIAVVPTSPAPSVSGQAGELQHDSRSAQGMPARLSQAEGRGAAQVHTAESQGRPADEAAGSVGSVCEDMMRQSAACVQALVCCCVGVRQGSAAADMTAAAPGDVVGGADTCDHLQGFMQWLGSKIQVSMLRNSLHACV